MSRPPASHNLAELRLLTWNIHWGVGLDGRLDLARIAHIIARCNADVACLQEVAAHFPDLPGSEGEDQPAVLSSLLPGHAAIFAPACDFAANDPSQPRRQFGNLILTRRPIAQVLRHLLPWPAAPSPSMPRVCLEITLADTPLRVMTTHLEYYGATQRMAQIHALNGIQQQSTDRARQTATSCDGDPMFLSPMCPPAAILCGDFNCKPHSPEYQQLLSAHFHDAWSACHPRQPPPATFRFQSPQRACCCDFIFVSAEVLPHLATVELVESGIASDHLPLLMQMSSL